MLVVVPLLLFGWLSNNVPFELSYKNSSEVTKHKNKKKQRSAKTMSFESALEIMLEHGFLPQLPAIPLSSLILSVQKTQGSHFQGIGLRDSKKPILLHFWATWCGPCKRELPAFADFVGSQDVIDTYTISSELKSNDTDIADKIWHFYNINNIKSLNVCMDINGKLAAELGISGIPTTFLLSSDGFLLGRFLGVTDWSNKLGDALINFFLEFKESSN